MTRAGEEAGIYTETYRVHVAGTQKAPAALCSEVRENFNCSRQGRQAKQARQGRGCRSQQQPLFSCFPVPAATQSTPVCFYLVSVEPHEKTGKDGHRIISLLCGDRVGPPPLENHLILTSRISKPVHIHGIPKRCIKENPPNFIEIYRSR